MTTYRTEGFPPQQQTPPGSTEAMSPRPDHGEDTYVGHNLLQGKKAIITGGDSGIGRATAIAFAREGADVAFTYLPAEEADAQSTAGVLREANHEVLPLATDLRSAANCREVVDRVVAEFGEIDVLINNAGFQMARDESLLDISDDRIDDTFKTNLYPLFWLTRAALPYLGPGSVIINTSSIQAYQPSTSLLDYAATKAAINNFTVNLAAELGPQGIRVNAVAPGPIWTPLQPATQPEEKLMHFGQDTPLGRAGQPAEVAPAYVFLATDAQASYISGTVLGVTGGKPVF